MAEWLTIEKRTEKLLHKRTRVGDSSVDHHLNEYHEYVLSEHAIAIWLFVSATAADGLGRIDYDQTNYNALQKNSTTDMLVHALLQYAVLRVRDKDSCDAHEQEQQSRH